MLVRAVALFVLFVAGSGAITVAQRTERVPARQKLTSFPMMLAAWQGRVDPPLTEKELTILGADDYMLRTYFTAGKAASVYVGFWESQSRGDAVHSPLNCLPGSGWQPMSYRPLSIAVTGAGGSQRKIDINRYVIQKGLDRQMVLYWYQSHDRVIASEYWGKFYLVADAIRLGRSDTAIVRVVTAMADGTAASEAKAEQHAVEFVQELFPALTQYVPS